MTHHPRHVKRVSSLWLGLLRPILRYSFSRDAYVLRVVGHHVGPVYRDREHDA